jgi:hypothetical protein
VQATSRPRMVEGGALKYALMDLTPARGTVRNLVCGAIVKPQEASYGDQEGYTG